MSYGVFARRWLGLCVAVAAFFAGAPAAATAAIGCTPPTLTQPFLQFGDANWYTIAPGQSYDNFLGSGWVLTGGAKMVLTTLHDGARGFVLDLPSGARATSPPMWITTDYPTARAMVRNMAGSAGVNVFISSTAGPLQSTGTVSAGGATWLLSRVTQIHPASLVGLHLAQFTLIGVAGEYQIYNFYVDPRMH